MSQASPPVSIALQITGMVSGSMKPVVMSRLLYAKHRFGDSLQWEILITNGHFWVSSKLLGSQSHETFEC